MSANEFPSISEIRSEPVEWLWDGRIPRGKVTLLEGDSGIGKSTLALDLAARVSRGGSMPLSKAPSPGPANVVLFSGNDDLADTVRPRLEAANADLALIRPINREISKADVEELKPALIILDPLSAYICLACERTAREVMLGLSRLADETNAAVLVTECLPEDSDSEWAREVVGAARSVLSVTALGHGGRRLGMAKSILRPVSEIAPLVYHHDDKDGIVRIVGWSDGR